MTEKATARALSVVELQDAAIEVSRILRDAKVEPLLRPKALAAMMVAVAHQARRGTGEDKAETQPLTGTRGVLLRTQAEARRALASLNRQVAAALVSLCLPAAECRKLRRALRLAGPDFERLAPFVPQLQGVLNRAGLTAALDRDVDVLGIFYEAFLRYGYDNNALGIVFTPRHVARFCAELIGVGGDDRVIDLACGTGGFLVAADAQRLCTKSAETQTRRKKRAANPTSSVICGCDTNPTVWALALLNMLFRARAGQAAPADIQLGSCFEPRRQSAMRRRFTRAFLNPPFSQDAEPERDFIDATLEALQPSGRCAVVVKAGIFADEDHVRWRAEFTRRHRLLGIISLPEDVFYPTAVPASILLAEAHVPQPDHAPVLMARVWNDGFEKLKNRRVEREGCELPEVARCFHAMLRGERFCSSPALVVDGACLQHGAEWSPQQWLPQPPASFEDLRLQQKQVIGTIFKAVAEWPELADVVLADFTRQWQSSPLLPLATPAPVTEFFQVLNGRSAGEKHYRDGVAPYVSSGGMMNSIVRLVEKEEDEVFAQGGITVTAFGQAAVQPWPFLARGNGGSSVRVLVPRYRMNTAELAWFAAQINAQQWRFFYARMAIKSRLERLMVTSPPAWLPFPSEGIAERVRQWRAMLADLSEI